jgi:DNA-binding NarL/FixJ family response regulator
MRVVIAEDEPLLREGMALVLGQHDFEVVDSVGSADDLRSATARLRPDLVVTDIRMPPHYADDGLRAALDLREQFPSLAVVVLSQHVMRRYAVELLGDHSQGIGYLLKHRVGDVEGFCRDLRRVGEGGTVLDSEVVSRMLARSARDNRAVDLLTPRQFQVLQLIAEGRSNAAIAATLHITEKAVVRHASQIYDALGLSSTPDDHRRVLAVVRMLSDPD